MKINLYKTKDLWEAGALIVNNIDLISIEREGSICFFLFKDVETAKNKANEYYFGSLKVDAYKYQEAISRLKRQIFNNK